MTVTDALEDIIEDQRNSRRLRKRAEALLRNWKDGYIISIAAVMKLYKAANKTRTCARLIGDRSCLWLRKHAAEMGLKKPKPGERAYCKRVEEGTVGTRFIDCVGFKHEMHDSTRLAGTSKLRTR